jgi:two-component system sensor histidine kinase QseC
MRRQLLVIVLGLVGAVWLATAIVSYVDARHEIDELLDAHLAQSASLLIAQAGHEFEELTEHSPDVTRYARRVAFQFWEGGAVLRLHSAGAPDVRLSAQDEGFSDAEIDGHRWRVFSGWDTERRYLLQVAERTETRNEIVGAIAKVLLLPLAVALPVLAVLLWVGIERVTRPLRRLNREVARRAPDNLAPLWFADTPLEFAPLVNNLNLLFGRVRTSMENERRFTADAAHELRTPLAALRAQAQVARSATRDAERDRALDQVIAGCDRATHLIHQLLTLARLEPERFHAEKQSTDLRDIARNAIADIAPSALTRQVDVELEAESAVSIDADARLIAILLRNLLDNAVRYSPPRSVVRVNVGVRDATSFVKVSDEGPGVPVEARVGLGRRFHRLADGQIPGTGLGLSIVKRIAELHEAALAFDETMPGKGLSVTLSFAPGSR